MPSGGLRGPGVSEASQVVLKRRADVSSRSGEVEAVELHHLRPRRGKVLDELRRSVSRGIDLREGAQLRVRAEDEVDAGSGPLDLAGLPIAPLIDTVAVH